MQTMTRYLVQPRDGLCKRLWLFCLAKNKGNNFGKSISKYLSGECSQKLSDHAKKSARGALKTSLKKVTQKTAEATCDSIGSKFFDNITEISIASLQKNSETLWK